MLLIVYLHHDSHMRWCVVVEHDAAQLNTPHLTTMKKYVRTAVIMLY